MKLLFTGDQHFKHKRILGYANRPFADAEEMDAELIKRWNEVVDPDDKVFHLGDFIFGKPIDAAKYFAQLNGQIHVLANHWHHDRRWLPANVGPSNVYISKSGHQVMILPPMVVLEFKEFGKDRYPLALTLCHYPLLVWDRKHYGAIHAFAHSHGKTEGEPGSIDVGIDNAYKLFGEYRPFSLEEILSQLGVGEENENSNN